MPQFETFWWIFEHFRILPTDERFQSLTPEQISLLVAMYNRQERKKEHIIDKQRGIIKESFYDDEFEREWERLKNQAKGVQKDG